MSENQSKQQPGVSLAPVVAEAERILREAIAHFKLQVKPESIVVTVQTRGRRNALGWFWNGRWKQGKNNLSEINLSAESLSSCDVGELLIHELAHAENDARDIHDCSGKAHNKHFKTMAESLGLVCAEKRDKKYGWGFTKLGPAASDFLAKVKFNRSIFDACRTNEVSLAKAGSRLLKAECPGCGYTIRVTRKWADVGMPKCPCGSHMEEA